MRWNSKSVSKFKEKYPLALKGLRLAWMTSAWLAGWDAV